ncbi:MAG TPA: arylamine N-acetyltransferase [Thermoanaerobaculia bacterium]|jgi:N-hydroxyarylamine O-acetyltransferase|nr:arylamine N-acetyltransferase [Thermoanaerobaculia bacterium]
MRLDDYLRRTGASAPRAATVEAMRALHLAHRQNILFENLDIQRGRPILLDLDALQRKLVDDRRGGYCFEHNTLFAAVLREYGFQPATLLARVRRGPPERWARTHMLLRVESEGAPWIADVGFGGSGLLEPMRLAEGSTSEQGGMTYSLRREGIYWVLSMRDASAESDFYEFTEEPNTPADVEIANHFTSTHPESIFRKTLTIQRATTAERVILRGTLLSRFRSGVQADEPFAREQLDDVVRKVFAVELGEGPFVFEQA